MGASATRSFTPTRIVALALIAAVIAGLAYLRFGTESEPVSVPAGAQAGDLILEHCSYDTEDGTYAADCGTLVAPENRHKAGSRLIALPVTRIRARSAEPGIPIFRLQGGPGITNMDFALASRFADKHDVVLVGYRGVDGSSKLDCPEVTSAREHAHGFLTAKSLRADAEAYKDCAQRRQADRDYLCLALSKSDPPLGDDRCQPARQLSLGRQDHGRADRPLRRALREERLVP
jgi:hypothetical protein